VELCSPDRAGVSLFAGAIHEYDRRAARSFGQRACGPLITANGASPENQQFAAYFAIIY
jgi:hypothetical protein